MIETTKRLARCAMVAATLAVGCGEPPATHAPAVVDIIYHPDGRVEVDRQSLNELPNDSSGPVMIRLIRNGEVVLEHGAATLRQARAFLQQQDQESRKEVLEMAQQPDASPESRAVAELLASIPPEPDRALMTVDDMKRLADALEAAADVRRNYANMTSDERVRVLLAVRDSVDAVMSRANDDDTRHERRLPKSKSGIVGTRLTQAGPSVDAMFPGGVSLTD